MICGCTHEVVVQRTGVAAYPGAASRIARGGASVIALYGPLAGGIVQNPRTAREQGIAPIVAGAPTVRKRRVGAINSFPIGSYVPFASYRTMTTTSENDVYGPPEVLYLSLVGPAALRANATTVVLFPGESRTIPPNTAKDVWVNAATTGHRFTAIAVQPVTPYPPTPYDGTFPPSTPTTKTTTIPSYLYEQYQDDDDLQALVASYNQSTQAYVDAFNALNLPVYTGLSGALLDWVGNGLYGVARPTLYSGRYRSVGAFNTFALDTLAIGALKRVGTFADVAVTSDDVYKRIITWHVWKSDGKQVGVQWIKRRVVRFLYGVNGADARGSAQQVSVLFSRGALTITIVTGKRRVTGGAIFGKMPFNKTAINSTTTVLTMLATPPLAAIFKEAVDTGALELPAQYVVTCRIGTIGTR